ncbi:unnamed protein product, partial [Discosporangium mesarthrocarpum]
MERLTRAFIFHEELATADESASAEEVLEQVLWYYPQTETPMERMKHVGLSQALLSFADRFSAHGRGNHSVAHDQEQGLGSVGGDVEIVRMRKHCHGFLQCEPKIWLVFVVKKAWPWGGGMMEEPAKPWYQVERGEGARGAIRGGETSLDSETMPG